MKINVPPSNLPRVVIVGGGFGGITLAQSLRKANVQVVMFDRNNFHNFQPLMYQVATGGLEPDSIAFPLRKLFKRQRNFFFRIAEVEGVDPFSRLVKTNIGDISYDYLVIATGSKTNFFGMDKVEAEAMGLKSIPEALNLRSLILQNFEGALISTDVRAREALQNFVIVGAGPTGVEMAGALAELKRHILPKDYPELDIRTMQIHLVEAASRVLPGMSEKSSANALKALEKLGVQVWTETRVENYDGNTVVTSAGKDIYARTLIWSAGVKGDMIREFKVAAGKGNRYEVDEFNRVKGQDRIFAIGDVALMQTEDWSQGHPGVAQTAIQQGRNLANNLLRLYKGQEMRPFRYRDKGSMATIGRNKAVVDMKRIKFKGRMAWLVWITIHLFFLAGFRNKLVVFINWFWSYLTYDRGTRLIIRPFKKQNVGPIPVIDLPEKKLKKNPDVPTLN